MFYLKERKERKEGKGSGRISILFEPTKINDRGKWAFDKCVL